MICYSVEIVFRIDQFNEGIHEYKLFDLYASAVDYAKDYMERMFSIEDYEAKDSTEDDVLHLFEAQNESVIIRRKDLHR